MFQAKETDIFFGNETAAGDIQFGLLNSVRKLPFLLENKKKKQFFFQAHIFSILHRKRKLFSIPYVHLLLQQLIGSSFFKMWKKL